MSSLLIELIFRGSFDSVKFSFLKNFLFKAKDVYFNAPEIPSVNTFNELVEIIHTNSYLDLVINTDNLSVYEKKIPKVFINLERNENETELLFFFDLKDLNGIAIQENVDYLKKWAIEFKSENNFEYFICKPENGKNDKYYFDSYGIGELYNEVNN